MYELTAENKKGKKFELTGNQNYEVLNISGLNPPNANINMSSASNIDGKIFNSAKINERNIVIMLKIKSPVEKNRIALYDFFQLKQYVKIYYSNGTRDVYTEGYIETIECEVFTENEVMQISILCPTPFFKSTKVRNVEFGQVINLFQFPFSIPEEGIPLSEIDATNRANVPAEHDAGVIITLTATGYVENPTIYNVDTRGVFKINITMTEKDQIIINTNRGEKSIQRIRSGVIGNIINYISMSPEWFQLENGDNVFAFEAQSGAENLKVSISHRPMYEGV